MRSEAGGGCEEVRERRTTKTCIRGCGPRQTWLPPSSKATSAFPQNPEATGWGREKKRKRVTGKGGGQGEGKTREGGKLC